MGQLEAGARPLDWEDAKAFAEYIKEHGITQLINIYHRLKDRTGDRLQWGDEVNIASEFPPLLLRTSMLTSQIEYMVIKLDPATRTARLSLRSAEILHDVAAAEQTETESSSQPFAVL